MLGYNRLQDIGPSRGAAKSPCEAALGDQLKTYFDTVVLGPAPDRLMKLAEALDQAFDQGQFKCGGGRRPTAGAR